MYNVSVEVKMKLFYNNFMNVLGNLAIDIEDDEIFTISQKM